MLDDRDLVKLADEVAREMRARRDRGVRLAIPFEQDRELHLAMLGAIGAQFIVSARRRLPEKGDEVVQYAFTDRAMFDGFDPARWRVRLWRPRQEREMTCVEIRAIPGPMSVPEVDWNRFMEERRSGETQGQRRETPLRRSSEANSVAEGIR